MATIATGAVTRTRNHQPIVLTARGRAVLWYIKATATMTFFVASAAAFLVVVAP